jgi:rifampicin phosphotransferase
MITFLPLVEPLELADVGGKAWSLAKIKGAGLRVPAGVVLPRAAFDDVLERIEARSAIEKVDVHDTRALESLSTRMRELVREVELPGLADAIASVDLPGPYAVRSSAIGEDGERASFAGQLDSVLGVTTEQIERAIRVCFASYFHARAIFYQRTRGAPLRGMAVIVQTMIEPTHAGVLFTRSPARAEDVLVEYGYGLSDKLVSGNVDPGRIAVDRETRKARVDARPEERDETLDAALSPSLEPLVSSALALERLFGAPQDIEWAVDAEGITFLQSRPITTFAPPPIASGSRLPGPEVRFTNANVNESFPGPISPFLYSVARTGYYHYFRNVGRALGISEERLSRIEHPLRQIVGVHGGRMYYNLTSIYEVLRAAPFGGELSSYFDQFAGVRDPRGLSTAPARAGALLELVNVAVQTTRRYSDLASRIADFERTIDAFAAATHPSELEERSRHELLLDLRAFFQIRCHEWTNASLADTGAMVTYGVLARVLRAAFPEVPNLNVTLMKGVPDVVSIKPVEALWDLSRAVRGDGELARMFVENAPAADILAAIQKMPKGSTIRTAWTDYLENWGYRGSGELMLTSPSFQENPAGLVEVVRRYIDLRGNSPRDAVLRQAAEREAETERILRELRTRPIAGGMPGPLLSTIVTRLLAATHASIGYRERARLKQALLYSRLRRVVLTIGMRLVEDGRLAQRDDVFFLTHQELDDLLSGASMFPHGVRDLVALRKKEHAALGASAPPDTVSLPAGEYLPLDARAAEEASTDATLEGTGTCSGTATAPAALLRDLGDAAKLRAGDILVAKQTDPGWAPVFFLVRGLVTERGGMLSHGAIIAREFGIPAVGGVRDATKRIQERQEITVDGDQGRVTLT